MIVRTGAIAVLLAFAIISSPAAADTIPHERFDEAQLDLAVLMLLLNESLRLATESVLSCVADDGASAMAYSDALAASIAAPAAIVQSLSEDIESYGFLATFIPPFQGMSSDDSVLTEDYSAFLVDLTALRDLASDDPLPAELYEQALALISSLNNRISQLYHDLDVLEADAWGIDALPEIPDQGDLDVTPLLEAIQMLRERLRLAEDELAAFALRIQDPVPHLVLTANRGTLYLGDTLILSGYLIYEGSFVPDLTVSITRDGALYTVADTGATGRFAEEFWIPVNASYLGTFVFQAHTEFGSDTVYSDEVTVTVLRVPTRMSFEPLETYALGSDIVVDGTLADFRGGTMPGQEVLVLADDREHAFPTDTYGRFTATIDTADLAWGAHTLEAVYEGNATHAPCTSGIFTVLLKYPAALTLELSATSVKQGASVYATGTFTNATGEPVAGVSVRLMLDHSLYAVSATNSTGGFMFALDTHGIGPGNHTLYAEHNGTGTIWMYTRSPDRYLAVLENDHKGYFPGVISGSGDLFDWVKRLLEDIFFGEHALIAWLVLIALVVLAYIVYRKLKARARKRREKEEEVRRALVYETVEAPTVKPLRPPGPIARRLSDTALWRLIDSLLGSMTPREAVVLGYGRFLEFLKAERDIAMDPSLTHVEIQGELVFMGFPKEDVGSATRIYERAMYSTKDVTVEDALGFAEALGALETFGKEAPG